MIATLENETARMWAASGNPDNDVNNTFIWAEIGNFYLNTSALTLWFCTAGGSGTQVWQQIQFV